MLKCLNSNVNSGFGKKKVLFASGDCSKSASREKITISTYTQVNMRAYRKNFILIHLFFALRYDVILLEQN